MQEMPGRIVNAAKLTRACLGMGVSEPAEVNAKECVSPDAGQSSKLTMRMRI
jgi:hypothetical protein